VLLKDNRKEWVILETLSKRRPLVFQVDDFLFPDECEHIKKQATDLGFEKSMTEGDRLVSAEGEDEFTGIYDDIGLHVLEMCDSNRDINCNVSEVCISYFLVC